MSPNDKDKVWPLSKELWLFIVSLAIALMKYLPTVAVDCIALNY